MNKLHKALLLTAAVALVLLSACSGGKPTPSTMAGFWMDNDNNVTTIAQQGDGFAATMVYDLEQSHSQNALISTEFTDGVLTWKYCPPSKPCLTMQTVSFNGNTIDVTWTNDNGESGTMSLKRVEKGQN